jgi:hypothetical protein
VAASENWKLKAASGTDGKLLEIRDSIRERQPLQEKKRALNVH